MGTDGEREALASDHHLYTEEGSRGDEVIPPAEEEVPEPHNILGQFHQDALTQVRMGGYQWLIGLIAGLCFMADGIQVFLLPYIVPSIQAEYCLEDKAVHWIYDISMYGLFFGALTCSIGDHIGRKNLLIFALLLHFIFNCMTATAQTFNIFLISRFWSSLGVGMCYPLACIYFSEFLQQNARGKLSVLFLFWALGGFYVIFLAYNYLPPSGEEVFQELAKHQTSWYEVFLLSSIPTGIAFIILLFTSESIRYLLHSGKDVNAIQMYQQIYKWNASMYTSKNAQYQLTELELPRHVVSSKPPPSKNILKKVIYNIEQFYVRLKQLGMRQYMIPVVLLSLAWAALGFSYYGMSLWIPEQLQGLKDARYFSNVKIVQNEEQFLQQYKSRLENQIFENVTFESCLFGDMIMSHVTFKNCSFNNSDFSGIHSSKTYFIDSIIENSRFYSTEFTEDRFINTPQINVRNFHLWCRIDFDFRITHNDKLREDVLRLITPFIALTVQCLCLYTFSRNKVGAASMLLCSLMSIACWFLRDEIPFMIFDFVWSIIFLFAFNSATIITVEAFPVHLRTTGFGVCFACFRLFGFLSSAVTYVIPFTISLLLIGGIALFRIQDTSFNLM